MSRLMYFLVGGALGAVGALLFAPRTGEETRNMVADYAGNVANDAQAFGAKAAENIQNGVQQVAEKGQEAFNNMQNAASDAATAAADKNDELRAKIEAARDRIAAQVKQWRRQLPRWLTRRRTPSTKPPTR